MELMLRSSMHTVVTVNYIKFLAILCLFGVYHNVNANGSFCEGLSGKGRYRRPRDVEDTTNNAHVLLTKLSRTY